MKQQQSVIGDWKVAKNFFNGQYQNILALIIHLKKGIVVEQVIMGEEFLSKKRLIWIKSCNKILYVKMDITL